MLVLAIFMGAIGAATAAPIAGSLVRSPPQGLVKSNFREREVPAVGGVVVLFALLVSEAALAAAALLGAGSADGASVAYSRSAIARTFTASDHLGLFLVALGFFAFGTLDDLAGAGRARGFLGHARALRRGEITGGAVKAIGGGALALVAAAQWEMRLGPALLDAAIVALSANLVNLLDLRPGRATKVFLVAWGILGAAAWPAAFLPLTAPAAAAAAVWLPTDLRERGMLGDGGSNLLGGLLGAGVALTLSAAGKSAALGLLLLVTAASERWSYTRIIERVAPVRWFDRLGRSPD